LDPGVKDALRVEDGWLVAFNQGEWGGELRWYSADGKQRRKISYHQVNQFLQTKEAILALEGEPPIGRSTGSVLRLVREKGGWTATTYVKLDEEARAGTVLPDGTLIVATCSRLLRITPTRTIEQLISEHDSAFLYSTSLVVSESNIVYVGTRTFVVAYDLTKKGQPRKLLVPSRDFLRNRK
jgi:hypothetical protein